MKHAILLLFYLPVFVILIGHILQAATTTCNSCIDCSEKIAIARAGDVVELSQDVISGKGDSCVDFGSAHSVIFDGKGYEVSFGSSGTHGIYLGSGSAGNNTIQNLEVRGFTRGIYVVGGGSNTFINNNIMANNIGIDLTSSSHNTLDNLLIGLNNTGLNVGYDSDSNVIKSSFIIQNLISGITFLPQSDVGDPENNFVYNNIFDNNGAYNVYIKTTPSDANRDLSFIPFIFSLSSGCDGDANLLGCGCIRGNYWGGKQANNFSKTCVDIDTDGICDNGYTIFHTSAVLTDLYPLTVPPTGCCVESDRDGDTYRATACGGNDFDDDPISCGADCYPSAPEVCDGYDNDGNGKVDDTITCLE